MTSYYSDKACEVHCGDCRDLILQLCKFDFVFADPPFNIGHRYTGYEDRKEQAVYFEFMHEWMCKAWASLKNNTGVMAIHVAPELDFHVHEWASDLNIRKQRLRKIIWHYRFGQCGRSNWINTYAECHVYSKSDAFTWNPEAVLVESDRVKCGDKRIDETENGGMRVPGTVWGVPSDGSYWGRITGGNKERRKNCPNQLPEVYLQRLILAYTNPGDHILDPFAGSGTTAVVAAALGRRCVTIDISEATCESVVDRLKKGAVRC